MTVIELITASLRLLGVATPHTALKPEDSACGLEALNLLLKEWRNAGLLSLTTRQNFDVSSGVASYTIGTGWTWSGVKPLKILAAYLSRGTVAGGTDGYDYQLRIIGETEYMELTAKGTLARPRLLFYSNTTHGSLSSLLDYGDVYLYPTPDQNYRITILSHKQFDEYAYLTTGIDLPDGYLSALKYNLAVELAPEYEREPSAWILKRANDTLATIRRTNAALKIAKAMILDPIFSRGESFDINTGY